MRCSKGYCGADFVEVDCQQLAGDNCDVTGLAEYMIQVQASAKFLSLLPALLVQISGWAESTEFIFAVPNRVHTSSKTVQGFATPQDKL